MRFLSRIVLVVLQFTLQKSPTCSVQMPQEARGKVAKIAQGGPVPTWGGTRMSYRQCLGPQGTSGLGEIPACSAWWDRGFQTLAVQ